MLHIKTRPALILLLLAFSRDPFHWVRGRGTGTTADSTFITLVHVGASCVSPAPTFQSQSARTPLLLLSKPNPLRWASVWLWKRPFHEIEYLSNCCVPSQASYRLRRVFCASHQNASRAPLRRVCGRAAEAKPQKPPPGRKSRGWFLQMLSRCNSSCARRWRTPGPGSGCCWGGKCWYRRRSSPPRCLRRSVPAHTHQRCR